MRHGYPARYLGNPGPGIWVTSRPGYDPGFITGGGAVCVIAGVNSSAIAAH